MAWLEPSFARGPGAFVTDDERTAPRGRALSAEMALALRSRGADLRMHARVWRRIRQNKVRRRRMRPAALLGAAAMFCVLSTASAMMWKSHETQGPVRIRPVRASPRPLAKTGPVPPTVTQAVAVPTRPVVAVPAKHVATAVDREEGPLAMREPAQAPSIVDAVAHLREAPAAESELVLDAYVTLRRQHQAARATEQLDAYLARFPDGALVAEALELAMDASDVAEQARYAQRYLARYPHGRAVQRANEILGKQK